MSMLYPMCMLLQCTCCSADRRPALLYRDVIDPALMAQDIWQAVAIVHGYSRINATRTSLNFQVPP